MSKKETQGEDVIDAKAGEGAAVAVVNQETQVSTTTTVAGITLRFPFIRVGQALSQWRCEGRPPMMGNFYIGKDKTNNALIAEMGRDKGFNAILLAIEHGMLEDKPFNGANNPPKRWMGPTFKEDAAKEGFDLTPRPTGQTWPDSGAPIVRANASMFCYLHMLVPITEDQAATMMDYQIFPIGEKLYTPARIEYSKQAYRGLMDVVSNVERMEQFHHRKEEGYKFDWQGKIVHIFSEEAVSKQTSATYPLLKFNMATSGGKMTEFTPAEKADFLAFLMSVKSVQADVNDVESSEFV